MTWALLLTWIRIALIPLFVVAFYLPGILSGPFAASIFILASLTDWLDGYLARRLKETTKFGAFLDPVADKLLVVVAMILLVSGAEDSVRTLIALCAVIIIGREITVAALREWMAEVGQRKKLAVTFISKIKTTLQMTALSFLLYHIDIGTMPTYRVGVGLLVIAAALTLWSMWIYVRASWPHMRAHSVPVSTDNPNS